MPDTELSPEDISRRGFLRSAGLLGTGVGLAGTGAAISGLGAPGIAVAHAGSEKTGGFRWLSGDHHIHTQYSSDGKYRVVDQVQHGVAYGLDWRPVGGQRGTGHRRLPY